MTHVTCRCGQPLSIPAEGPDRIVCPHCSARIRVRRDRGKVPVGGEADDGYIRFDCPCGRRLKVRVENAQEAGKCPDCGRVVPVPDSEDLTSIPARKSRHVEEPTEELSPEDIALLERWARRHLSRKGERTGGTGTAAPGPSAVRIEAGLRVCPRCGRPVHLGAAACRECGATVPRR